uniref:Uncharacterized protein n=1 Tax=Trichogramma kaykai TaxID=54128 RepID=A0ABD2VYI8_9HYME
MARFELEPLKRARDEDDILNDSCDFMKRARVEEEILDDYWDLDERDTELLQRFNPLLNMTVQDSWIRASFTSEEVDRLLCVAPMNCSIDEDYAGQRIIEKVAASGYIDIVPSIECDKPVHRTTPVHHAAKTRFCNWQVAARLLLKIYANFRVDYIDDESGLNHMHVACMSGAVDVVEECLKLGYDIDRRVTVTGDSLLHLSVEHSQVEMFAFLLRRGVDINSANSQGSTALHLLGQRFYDDEFAEIFFRLIDENSLKVQIDFQDKSGNTALHVAVDNKHRNLMKLLLRRGADPNVANDKGQTFLHALCSEDIDSDILELLFKISDEKKRPLLINAQDERGNTPLHLALEEGLKVTAELLLKRGASLNLENNDGSKALHVICKRATFWTDGLPQWFFKLNQNLLRTITVDARDNSGKTPLELALSDGNESLARLLLNNGASVSLANYDGSTPLHLVSAKEGDNKNLLEFIFELGKEKNQLVQVDARDKKGRTPLHITLTSECKIESVRFLLDKGADISAVDDEKLTTLHYICNNWKGDADNLLEKFFQIIDDQSKEKSFKKFKFKHINSD